MCDHTSPILDGKHSTQHTPELAVVYHSSLSGPASTKQNLHSLQQQNKKKKKKDILDILSHVPRPYLTLWWTRAVMTAGPGLIAQHQWPTSLKLLWLNWKQIPAARLKMLQEAFCRRVEALTGAHQCLWCWNDLFSSHMDAMYPYFCIYIVYYDSISRMLHMRKVFTSNILQICSSILFFLPFSFWLLNINQ